MHIKNHLEICSQTLNSMMMQPLLKYMNYD